jgi:uridine phosphorylase
LAEGEADVERWYQQGFSAVDMETATSFAVAEYFGMDRTAILYVFDNPRRREHILLTDEEEDAKRERANQAARELEFRQPDGSYWIGATFRCLFTRA